MEGTQLNLPVLLRKVVGLNPGCTLESLVWTLRQYPKTSYFVGLEDPVIGLFLKAPQAIPMHSQS